MADDANKPDPIDDLKKGLGLLFRAAKNAVKELPSDKLENIVVTGVKEVGRAIENVTDQIDRQVFGGKGTIPHPPPAAAQPAEPDDKPEQKPDEKPDEKDEKKDAPSEILPDEEPPRGPRVG